MSINKILLKNISFSYYNYQKTDNTATIEVFKDFDLKIPASKVSVILGPSGCGKSTLLHIIHGILTPERGSVEKQNCSTIAYLFQEPRILPWKTVGQNIELVLIKHFKRKERKEIIQHFLRITGLNDFIDFYPSDLSGGMLQRVSMARAFAYPADLILMDEPFQSLDPALKLSLTRLFSSLWIEESRTAVFVTHDVKEAVLLGDELYILSGEKPSTIIKHISNTVPHKERFSENPECLQIESNLLTIMAAY